MIFRRMSSAGRPTSPWRRPAQLFNDRRGGVAILVALTVLPLGGFVGMGVDSARAYIVRSRLSQALDAAGLAGGNAFYESTRDADIRMYFDANFPAGYLGATVTGPTIVADTDKQTLTISASASVPTTFMRLLGSEQMVVAASTEVTRRMQAMEVVLAIDISGSMGTKDRGQSLTRIQAAKRAANELVDILFGSNAEKDLLKIGLVPWSSKVKVMVEGQSFHSKLTTSETVPAFNFPGVGTLSKVYYANNSPVPLLWEPPKKWKGCVFERYVDDTTDANDGDIRDGTFTGGGRSWPGWEPVLPGDYGADDDEDDDEEDEDDDADKARAAWGGEPVSGQSDDEDNRCALAPEGAECTECPKVGITPLQSKKAVLTSGIAGLKADGYTNLPAGLGWAWRVLSVVPPFEHTIEAGTEPLRAIVLMTDGDNCAAYGDGYKAVFGLCDSTSRDKMNARAIKLADNIKADGVVIYVVQFVARNAVLENFLKTVASGRENPYYYFAPTAGALSEAFHEIANHLSELRLSK